jgi:hypothetical protein
MCGKNTSCSGVAVRALSRADFLTFLSGGVLVALQYLPSSHENERLDPGSSMKNPFMKNPLAVPRSVRIDISNAFGLREDGSRASDTQVNPYPAAAK